MVTLEAEAPLSVDETVLLETLSRKPSSETGDNTHFRLAVVPAPLPGWVAREEPTNPSPAVVHFGASVIRIQHHRYCAELDFVTRRGALYRKDDHARALGVVLRLTMTGALPFAGGLPIHGAGMVVGGRSLVFFGPSEAGKTTISRSSPWPVVSDEIVAVAGSPPCLRATGYLRWPGPEPRLPAPLVALVELAKSSETVIERLTCSEGLRRLLHNLWVPPVPLLQRRAVRVAADVVAAVPVYRLAWNPARPPFRAIEEQLVEV